MPKRNLRPARDKRPAHARLRHHRSCSNRPNQLGRQRDRCEDLLQTSPLFSKRHPFIVLSLPEIPAWPVQIILPHTETHRMLPLRSDFPLLQPAYDRLFRVAAQPRPHFSHTRILHELACTDGIGAANGYGPPIQHFRPCKGHLCRAGCIAIESCKC